MFTARDLFHLTMVHLAVKISCKSVRWVMFSDRSSNWLPYGDDERVAVWSCELRSLAISDLNLTSDQPSIVCQAEGAKNKKNAEQYIQPSLARSLAALIAGRPTQDRVFTMPHE